MIRLMFVFAIVFTLTGQVLSKGTTVKVKPYFKPKSGIVVPPSYRSSPNNKKWDNWNSKGNINPYTGKKGIKNPY